MSSFTNVDIEFRCMPLIVIAGAPASSINRYFDLFKHEEAANEEIAACYVWQRFSRHDNSKKYPSKHSRSQPQRSIVQ